MLHMHKTQNAQWGKSQNMTFCSVTLSGEMRPCRSKGCSTQKEDKITFSLREHKQGFIGQCSLTLERHLKLCEVSNC